MTNEILSGPLTVSMEITNKCMMRCLHCYNRSGDDLIRDELTDEQLLDIAKQLNDIKIFSFCFCGGEPLIRYELILKMAKILRKNCPNINMVSNGYLLTKEKAVELKLAGLTNIQISIDGANSKTHDYMRQIDGAFERAMEAVKILNEINMNITIAFSPTSFNIKEFPELVKKLERFDNVKLIRVQQLMVLGRGAINNINPTENQYRELVEFIKNYQKSNSKIRIEWGDPVDHLIRFSSMEVFQYTSVDIKSNGSLAVSSYLPIFVGNLKKHTLKEYWDNGLYKTWNIPIVREVASEYNAISNLGMPVGNIPKIFFENNIELDLIDDKVFENVDNFTSEWIERK